MAETTKPQVGWCSRCKSEVHEEEVRGLMGQTRRLWKQVCSGCGTESLPYNTSARRRISGGTERPRERRQPARAGAAASDWRRRRWDLDADEREPR